MSPSQYNPDIHHRRSIRLKGHDYAGGGLYFVTLCTHNRQQLFGRMEYGKVQLTEAGLTVEKCWRAIPEHFPGVEPKELAVMPDHVHGLIRMVRAEEAAVGAVRAKDFSPIPSPIPSPAQGRPCGTSQTLGSVVRGFKVGVTKWVRENTDVQDVWHRNYYEMIVRDAEAEKKITQYIRMNPWRCVMDFGNGLRGMGNPSLWSAEKLGVLCSRNAPRPASIPKAAAYLGGFHSPMEKEILAKLLCKGSKGETSFAPNIIWCPAWGLDRAAFTLGVREALEDNRMLILEMRMGEKSFAPATLAAAEQRNRFVLEQADRLWLPHVTPGGMLDRLVREMQVQGKILNHGKH